MQSAGGWWSTVQLAVASGIFSFWKLISALVLRLYGSVILFLYCTRVFSAAPISTSSEWGVYIHNSLIRLVWACGLTSAFHVHAAQNIRGGLAELPIQFKYRWLLRFACPRGWIFVSNFPNLFQYFYKCVMQTSKHSNDEYTIGRICALKDEFIVASNMLTGEHRPPQSLPEHDDLWCFLIQLRGIIKSKLRTMQSTLCRPIKKA